MICPPAKQLASRKGTSLTRKISVDTGAHATQQPHDIQARPTEGHLNTCQMLYQQPAGACSNISGRLDMLGLPSGALQGMDWNTRQGTSSLPKEGAESSRRILRTSMLQFERWKATRYCPGAVVDKIIEVLLYLGASWQAEALALSRCRLRRL